MARNHPHYCPEQIKIFGKTFTFADCFNAGEQQKTGMISDLSKPLPIRQVVVYEILGCDAYVRIEHAHARAQAFPPARGPWIAALQDCYTCITGPHGATIESAVSLFNLELGLIDNLLETLK